MKASLFNHFTKNKPFLWLWVCLTSVATGLHAQTPGGVNTGLQVWLKADAGTSSTTNGATLDFWNDQSGNARNHTQTTAIFKPTYKENSGFNFNPSVNFDGLDALSTNAFASGKEAVHVFAMARVDDNLWRSIYGFGRDATHVQWYNGGLATKPSVWLSGNHYPSTALGTKFGVSSYILPKDGSQKTIHWNGTSANIPGTNAYLYNTGKMAVGSDIDNSGFGLSENFAGDIQEVIIYKTGTPTTNGGAMTNADIQKIQSYLGLKYGVTLSHDYLNSAGTTVYALGSYGSNVAGIARENAQGLHQKQAMSASGGIQPTIGNVAITTLNSNNSNALADGSFMVWGSDNGAASFGTAITPAMSATANFRFTRIWRVQETGTVGTVKFAMPSNIGTGNTVYLVRSAGNATFDAADEYIPLTTYTVGATTYLACDVDFNNNDYYTIATYLEAPGCVAADIKVWLRADKGITGTTEITNWADQSGNGHDVNQADAIFRPALATAASQQFNFNPSIQFDGNGDHLEYKAGRFMAVNDPGSVFGVASNTLNAGYENLADLGIDNPHMGILGDRMMIWMNGSAPVQTLHANKLIDQQAQMYGWYWNGGTGGGVDLSLDGVITNEPDKDFNFVAQGGTVDGMFTVGGYEYVETWTGNIAEVIVYNRNLDATEKQKVNTYLAIKYGTTYPQDYMAAGGTVIYNQAGYKNNVAGIGREACQGLHQKQSKSVNTGLQPTIGNIGIATDNATNANNLTEGSFMVWGSNNANELFGTAITVPMGVDANFRMNRVWRVQETGTVGTVKFAMPSNTGTSGAVYLVRSTDATFDNTDTFIQLNTLTVGSITYLAGDIDFTNGDYFTIAKKLGGPGCVPGIAVWLKADAGTNTTTDAAAVSSWADQSGNGRDHVSVPGISISDPFYKVNSGFNFNPAINFDAAKGLMTPVFAQDEEAVHTFTVSKSVNNTSWQTIYSFGQNSTHPQWYNNGAANEPSVWLGFNYVPVPSQGILYGVTSHILNKTTADDQQIWWNGVKTTFPGNKGYIYNNSSGLSLNDFFFVGNDANWASAAPTFSSTEDMNGDIMEIAIYKTGTPTVKGGPMAELDIKKIQSYMGIKYGITLQHHYLSATGDTVYNISTYGNNVFGIAREDCQSLNQRQAQSYTSDIITIGIDGQIAATNPANTGTFDNDASFLLIGDNNATNLGDLDQAGPCAPPSANKFTNKIWKSDETGTVESVKVKADLAAFGFNSNLPVYMQVSSDAAFSSYSNVPMKFVGGFYEVNYDFNGLQYFRFAGNTTPPANICTGDKEFEWNTPFWTWGKKTDTRTIGDQTFTVTISDPDNVIYAPTVYPVGLGWLEHIFIPRYDNKPNSKITTKIAMSKTAAGASFEIFDMDHYIGGKDVVTVYGKQGATTVAPKFTLPQYTGLVINSSTKVSASSTPIVWDILNPSRLFVNFDKPIDEIYIEYTKNNTYSFPVYNDIRIRNINVLCKDPVPEVATADNVYIFKTAQNTTPKVGEKFTYQLMVQNLDCNDKTIDITDVLPSGLKWVDSTLSTGLSFGSVNAYGGGQTLTMTGVTVPAGKSFILIDAIASTTGTLNNQASFNVNGRNYLSDDPAIAGSTNPTPVTIAAGEPDGDVTITKTVDKSASQQNGVVKYTFTIKSNNANSTVVNFDDALPLSAKYVASTLTYSGGGTVTPYAGLSNLIIRNISVPANGTVSFTVDANVGTSPIDSTVRNIAALSVDESSTYREETVYSAPANTKIIVQDTDGDGVSDNQELADGTNPNNGCSYSPASQVFANTSPAWRAQDCDGDGLNNGEEVDVCKTDPLNPDTDGDGLSDNEEKTGVDDPGTPLNPGGNTSNPLVPDCFAEAQVLTKN